MDIKPAAVALALLLFGCASDSSWKSHHPGTTIAGSKCEIDVEDLYGTPVEANGKVVCGHVSVTVEKTFVQLKRLSREPADDEALQVVLGYPYPEDAGVLQPGQTFTAYIEGKADVFVECFDERPERDVHACVPFSRPVQIWATRLSKT